VKVLLLRSTLAASLLAAVSAPAADQPRVPAAPAVPPAPSLAVVALQSLLAELQQPGDRLLPATVRMERLAAHGPSPQTAGQLRAAFGTERLYTLERRPAQAGRIDWRLTFPALRYVQPQGTVFDWNEGWADFRFNQAGTTAAVDGGWGLLAVEDAQTRMAARGITLKGAQQRGQGGLWYGATRIDVAGVDIKSKTDSTVVGLTGLGMAVKVSEKKNSADMAYDTRIGRMDVGGERIDDLRFAFRITNIDKAALIDISEAGARRGNELARLAPEQQMDAMKPLLRSFGKAAVARGAAIEIDEIAASYHGARASIKGRVAVQGGAAADLDNLPALVGKIVARFDIRLPAALVREIAGAIAAKQAAQQGKANDPQALAQLRQSVGDIAIGKLLGDGYARMENDVLVSTVEWRGGELRANGKPVNLGPGPARMPPPAPGFPAADADLLQARRIDGSCTLPAYPDEVVRQDQSFIALTNIAVGADGTVKHAAMARPSKYPDYDRALVAALAQCRYVPALMRGQPVDATLPWQLVRTPGTARP
jgi:TonB family protein